MTLIEGFGDEVIGIFAVIMIALLTCVVWVSTSVADRPRASVLVSTRTADGSLIIQEGVLNDAIEEAMDTRMSGPRRFNSTDVEPPDDAASGAHQGETSSAAGAGEVGGDDAVLETDEEIRAHPDAIRVKLKYVNDSDKSVDGRLGEKLAEFKRRNFRPDLAAGKFVRLIFQGRMLTNEEETLAQHGLFDNCVVHCHVSNNHPRQSAGPQLDPNQTHHPAAFHHFNDAAILAQGEFEIELGNWMMPIAGFLLSILWSYWYQFGHFFSFLATVCLTVLTGLFFTVLLGIYSNVWSTPNNAPADQRPEERNNNAILVGLWNLNIPLPNFMSFLVGNPAAPAH